jgi:hypothetical protein
MHIVFIAHERVTEGEEAIEDQLDPNIGARLMPSLASAVNGAMSVIGNTFIREVYSGTGGDKIREVQYCMRVGPHAYYTTKVRKPFHSKLVIPEFIVNPTFDRLMAIAKGETVKRRKHAKA